MNLLCRIGLHKWMTYRWESEDLSPEDGVWIEIQRCERCDKREKTTCYRSDIGPSCFTHQLTDEEYETELNRLRLKQ